MSDSRAANPTAVMGPKCSSDRCDGPEVLIRPMRRVSAGAHGARRCLRPTAACRGGARGSGP
eukprot:4360722-Pyramimonas_sp.AAC.2